MTHEEKEFVGQTKVSLENQLIKLAQPVPWLIAHNRRRSVRQMEEILEQREKQKGEIKKALGVLSGEISGGISFIRDKDKQILGFKV